MSQKLSLRLKPYIQPFEHALALDELKAIAGSQPEPAAIVEDDFVYHVVTSASPKDLANRLAYWERVTAPHDVITSQSLRESTVNVVRNGVAMAEIRRRLPFTELPPLPNRRCLRYGPHGIHEYRGKFFPQLVRSLLNIAKVPPKGLVMDPMCGSGTTLVESLLAGLEVYGLDMNPLSVEMSRTKCDLLSADPDKLETEYLRIKNAILSDKSSMNAGIACLESLPARDQAYLGAWFPTHVLRDVDAILHAIAMVAYGPAQALFRMSLSNILRRVSWQKDDDLRIRKEVRPEADDDAVREFLEEVGRSVRFVVAFLHQAGPLKQVRYAVESGDARTADRSWAKWRGKVDAIVTSPPYATALPYLDTDRLSLCCLGLLTRPEHRRRDDEMIGNREVTERGRRAYWVFFEKNRHLLPASVQELIHRIDALNSTIAVGFRRRNLPALLAKYFLDMRLVLQGMHRLLKKGRPAFFVVGNNHTIAGGQRVEIETAALLNDIARMLGFEIAEARSMQMLTSRDIFRRNAVASEVILELRR